ncbi:transmembrane signal receptor [Lithospermum erythrorhizon]|uniref:Transmembrane signal receptor n=1 Tax=Lithospermum erythrorhizon TaxID=34254 RepID=A0AAV3PLA6_LITER
MSLEQNGSLKINQIRKARSPENKARLITQGYTQMEGIDFDDMYAPVARLESIGLLLSLACLMKIKLNQMDVKSVFLNGTLVEEVYVEQTKGFQDPHYSDHFWRLKKALYGLKQATRVWYDRLTKFLTQNGYVFGGVDNTFFVKTKESVFMMAQIYVDDIFFGGLYNQMVQHFVTQMTEQCEMSMDVGRNEKGEGIDVYRGRIGRLLYLTPSRPDIAHA